jgi:predicted nucleic acid-binding protein
MDTSALAKLVLVEAESAVLEAAVASGKWRLATSALSITELGRAARRAGPAASASASRLLADRLDIVDVDHSVLQLAEQLSPPTLRTLAAIHVASALTLGPACEGVVTYDVRMRDAAREAGFTVMAPGQIA